MLPSAARDAFSPSGHPLHTRSISLDAFQETPERLRAVGTILDLRKCGFVPSGREVQSAGFIHHMHWRCVLDEHGVIETLAVEQPHVAFEASPATAGECCRDPASRLQALVGSRFDAGFAKRLAGAFGGPLGCSHLVTLGQALGAFVPRVLASAERRASEREPGERVAKQNLMLDGFERAGAIDLAIQASEYWLAPQRSVQGFIDRAARVLEARVLGEIALAGMQLRALSAAARERTPETGASAQWECRDALAAKLAGDSALRGMAGRVRALAAEQATGDASALMTQTLLNFAPALIQCMAALTHRMPLMYERRSSGRGALSADEQSFAGSGGQIDSCFMWRAGSPANALRLVRADPAS
jgi:hypothetical protein